jgi:hypothetical protein
MQMHLKVCVYLQKSAEEKCLSHPRAQQENKIIKSKKEKLYQVFKQVLVLINKGIVQLVTIHPLDKRFEVFC